MSKEHYGTMKSWVKITGGLAVAGVVAAVLLYLFVYNKPHADYEKAVAAYSISAQDLYRSFTDNKPLADSLYTGKVLIISGLLASTEIRDSLTIAVFVLNQGLFGDEGIRCTMLPKFRDETTVLRTGFPVKIKGYCAGYNETDVILEHCSIIKK